MRPAFILAALLIAAPAAAVPIIPPMPSCHCTLVEVPGEPHINPPDPGYSPDMTLGEIAELRRLDDLHEPAPDVALFAWLCVELPQPWGKPGEPGEPERPHVPMGGGGSNGGGQPGGGSVPESSSLALAGVGIVGLWLRRRG